jgi:pterin-4a-carbinolamine dehydratase
MTSAEIFSAEDFNKLVMGDWRYLLGAIEATFLASSFGEGAKFIDQIAKASDEAQHHPSIVLRNPGLIRLRLITNSVGGLTQHDVDLASRISAIAQNAGFSSQPLAAERIEVGIDAMDIDGSGRSGWQLSVTSRWTKATPPLEKSPTQKVSAP